jgi:peptidyl-prolyl cis-trans isomerase D
MLNVMRDNLRHLKPILWVVAISLVAYLGAYFSCGQEPGGADAPWAARVDGTPISRNAFLSTARQRDQSYRELFGAQYEQFKPQLQIGRQSIEFLINRRIILLEAEKLGIGATDAEIQRRILEEPSLQGPDGQFIGKDQYVRAVERSWTGGVAAFEQYLADGIVVDKWMKMVASPARVDDEELLRIYRSRSDRTEIDFAVVAAADQEIATDISDDDLRAWYDSNAEDFRRPEGRGVPFAVVSRQDQLGTVEVTDEEIRAYYEEHRSEYSRPEQRRASHILLRVQPGATAEDEAAIRQKAEEIRGRIEAGESFEELANTFSEDELSGQRGGDLEFFPRGAMVPEFEQAAFDTPVDQLAPLTRTSFGFHIIKVTGARPAGTVPLEEMREDLREELRQRRADEEAASLAQQLVENAGSAGGLVAAARAMGFEAQERVVRRGETIEGLDAPGTLVNGLFQLEIGELSEPKSVRQGWAVLGVTEEVPSSIAPLDEVRAKVTTALLNERGAEAARAAAARALERHTGLEETARALGLEVEPSGPMTSDRVLLGTGGTSPELREALFGPDSAVGKVGVARVPSGAVVFEITQREVFDPTKFEESKETLREELLDQRRATIVEAALEGLRQGYRIEINDEIVSRLDA